MPTPPRSPEIQLLLDCLSASRSTQAQARLGDYSPEAWQRAVDLARLQGLLSLFTRRALQYARPSIPPAVLSDLTENSQAQALRSLQQVAEIQRVLAAFQGAGIPVIVLKGLHLRAVVYQDSMLRSMSDLDLLVAEEDLERGGRLLEDLGYSTHTNLLVEAHHYHRAYTCPQARFPIEVHWKIAGGKTSFQVDTPALWQRAQPLKVFGVEVLALAPEDLILHLGLHLGNHIFMMAVLRNLVDIAESLDHFGEKLDWAAIAVRARQWHVSRSIYLALALAQHYLNAAAPASLWPEVAREAAALPMLAFARTQIERQLGGEEASFLPHWGRFWQAPGWQAKLRTLTSIAFPPRAWLAQRYDASLNTWRMPLFYLRHWGELARDKLPTLLKLAGRSPAEVEKMEAAAQYNVLCKYLWEEYP